MSANLGTATGYLDLDSSKFEKGLKSANSSLKVFGKDVSGFTSILDRTSSKMSAVGKVATAALTTPLAGAGASIVKTGSKFESAMSQVAATMGKTKDEIKDLNSVALEMGSTTAFSATQAAEGLNYLALAGYDSKQQIAALPKVLDLAAAGNMDLAKASDMLTDSMSALGLASKDSNVLMNNMNTMVDQMAKTASSSNTSVEQLGEAILAVGGTAKNLAGGTTELNTVLGLMADNGMKASESGIHLRNIILAMTPETKKAKKAWEELGVQSYDSAGNMRKLEDIVVDLNAALADKSMEERTKILSQMFRTTDLKAVNALLDTSVERWDELGEAIEGSAGAAEKMAETQLDNLGGDFTLLQSSLEGLQIRFYNIVNGGLRDFVKMITNAVDYVRNLSDEQLTLIAKIAGVVAALGPVLLIGSKVVGLVSSIAEVAGTISTVVSSFGSLSSVFAALTTSASGIVAAFVAIIAVVGSIVAIIDALRDAWENDFNDIRENTENIANGIKDLFEGIVEVVTTVVKNIIDAWNNDFGGIKTSVETIVTSIVGIISGLVDIVRGIINTIVDLWNSNFLGIQDIVTGVFGAITTLLSGFLEFIAGIFDGINKLIHGDFEGALDAFKNAFVGLFDTVKDVLSKIVDTFGKWIKTIISKVGDFFKDLASNAKDKMNDFAERIKEGARNASDSFIEFIKELPGKIGYFLGEVLAKAVNFVVNFPKEAKKAGKKFLDNLIDFVKKLPSKIEEKFTNGIKKAGEFATNLKEKAGEAGSKFIDKIVEWFKKLPGKIKDMISDAKENLKKLPEKFKEAGKEAVEGIINGIKEKWENMKSAISDFGNNIVKGFKENLDIHSPSKRLQREVGEQIANGVIEGIKGKTNEGKKAAEKYSNDLVSEAKKGLQAWQELNQEYGAEMEAKYWKTILKQLEKGSKQYTEAYKMYAKAVSQIQADIYSDAEKEWDVYKLYNETTLKDEVDHYKSLRKEFKNGTDERIDADRKYFEAKQKLNDEIKKLDEQYVKDKEAIYKQLDQEVESLNTEYESALQNRIDSILNSFSLFKRYEDDTKTSTEELKENLQSQVEALRRYNTEVNKLRENSILPEDLIQEIIGMGVGATDEIEALNKMSESELQKYVELWQEKMKLAAEQAKLELSPLKADTEEKIDELRETADRKLTELENEYVMSMKKIGIDVSEQSQDTGETTVKSLAKGVDDAVPVLTNSLESMRQAMISTMVKIAAEARVRLANVLAMVAQAKAAVASMGGASGPAGTVSGSHKNGLDYVPYDGYIARLHKGEAVLTEEENKNRNNCGDIINNFYGTPPLDERETARQFKLAQQQLLLKY